MTAVIVSVNRPRAHRLHGTRERARAGLTLIEIMAVTAMIGALAVIALPKVQDAVERAKVARAIGDIRALQSDLDGLDSLPATLGMIGRGGLIDPWGSPYQYLRFPSGGPPSGARRDRFSIPLNTRYDLYSMGKDQSSSGALTSDDVVRANDGGYIGLASKF
jgi:general secretion pathway protein G